MNKSIIYLLFFTVYTFFLLFIGKSGFKRTETRRDFYIASGSLGISISVFTFVATWLSAASIQGFTGSVYYFGYSTILFSVLPWFFGAILMLFLVKKLRTYDIITLPEFFYQRYESKTLQMIAGIIIVLIYTMYIIIQIRGFGIVMSELLGINYNISILLIYLFIVYTSFGGLFSVAKSDGMNFFLIIFGMLISSYLIINGAGNLADIFTSHLEYENIFGKLSIENIGFSDSFSFKYFIVVFSGFFGWGLGLAANPQYIVRICSAKDDRTAYKMIWYSLLVLLIIYICLIIIGLGGRLLDVSFLANGNPDVYFPNLINNVLYSPFSGFILISIAAAAVSTANSQLLIVASSCCHDIFDNLNKGKISDDKFLNLNRIVIVIFASISLLFAVKPPESLLVFGGYLWGFFTATFFVPLYGGLFWEKGSRLGAYASMIGGTIAFIVFALLSKKSDIPINPGLPSFIISLVCYIGFSLKNKNRSDVEGEKYEIRHRK